MNIRRFILIMIAGVIVVFILAVSPTYIFLKFGTALLDPQNESITYALIDVWVNIAIIIILALVQTFGVGSVSFYMIRRYLTLVQDLQSIRDRRDDLEIKLRQTEAKNTQLEDDWEFARKANSQLANEKTLLEQRNSDLTRMVTELRQNPDNLTDREMEILLLVVQGKTNQEIAGELTISHRTVENHINNIRGKTGTANRTELATYALERQLTLDSKYSSS